LGAVPASAGPAAADQFCVAPAGGCSGGQQPTLQGALDAALAAPGRDLVQLPAGVVQGPGKYESANPDNSLVLVGTGRDATTITSSSAEQILTINQKQSLVSDLTIGQTDPHVAFQDLGFVAGTLERVGLVSTDTSGSMQILGTARQIVGRGQANVLINGTLEDADFRGTLLATGTADTVVRRARVEGTSPVFGQNRSLVISSSLFVSTSPTGAIASFSPSPVPNSQSTVLLSNVTMIGPGSPTCTGLAVSGDNIYPPPNDNAVENATLASSIVQGCGTSIQRNGGGGNKTANLTVFDSDLDLAPGAVSQSGAGTLTAGPGDGNIDTDPPFLDLPTLAQAPRFNSPLVDHGLTTSLSPEESTTDLLGNPRVVDGNGDGTAVRDIGAIEYQRHAPTASVSAPDTATAGASIPFVGSGTDADPGEEIVSYVWTFDEGGGSTGAATTHAFSTPGHHTATLTVTDSAGASARADAVVLVRGGAVSSIAVTPRRFRTGAKRAKASAKGRDSPGATVTVTLTAPSDLSLTLQRKADGRRSGKACVKPAKGAKGGKRAKPCTRLVSLPGGLLRPVGSPLQFHFDGRWNGKTLRPGGYVLSAQGASGPPRAAAFTLLGRDRPHRPRNTPGRGR
jgi:hypothetical protein